MSTNSKSIDKNEFSFNDWLDYIYVLPLGHKRSDRRAIKKVANHLDLLNPKPIVVTIAGTNGKGSVVRILEEILLEAGKKVASFTSPHMSRYQERIRINGREESIAKLCKTFNVVAKAIQTCEEKLSFFEFTFLTAMHIFKSCNLDVIVLEVGLGGRFDATNVVDTDIAVITSIDLDHMHILGKSRNRIGTEKSGIARAGKPLVCGVEMPESVVKCAEKVGAIFYQLEYEFDFINQGRVWEWCSARRRIRNLPIPNLYFNNAAIALMVIDLLRENFNLKILAPSIKTGVKRASLEGRFQVLSTEPCIVADVAHNPAATKLLAKNMRRLSRDPVPTIAVFSMLRDKDIVGSLKNMLPLVNEWYIFELENKRASSLDHLLKCLDKVKVKREHVKTFANIEEAFTAAKRDSGSDGRIVTFGSFYVVSEVIEFSK